MSPNPTPRMTSAERDLYSQGRDRFERGEVERALESLSPLLESRVRLLGHLEARLILQNEEHGVFHWDGDDLPAIGQYLLAIPGHVCPTTIRYPGSYVIDAEGAVVDFYPHTARDRQ